MVKELNISERRACRAVNQSRSTQRYKIILTDDEIKIRSRVIELAKKYGRYGYKRNIRIMFGHMILSVIKRMMGVK